jgi:hypothetical protein
MSAAWRFLLIYIDIANSQLHDLDKRKRELKKKLAATHMRIRSLVHQLSDEKARKKCL